MHSQVRTDNANSSAVTAHSTTALSLSEWLTGTPARPLSPNADDQYTYRSGMPLEPQRTIDVARQCTNPDYEPPRGLDAVYNNEITVICPRSFVYSVREVIDLETDDPKAIVEVVMINPQIIIDTDTSDLSASAAWSGFSARLADVKEPDALRSDLRVRGIMFAQLSVRWQPIHEHLVSDRFRRPCPTELTSPVHNDMPSWLPPLILNDPALEVTSLYRDFEGVIAAAQHCLANDPATAIGVIFNDSRHVFSAEPPCEINGFRALDLALTSGNLQLTRDDRYVDIEVEGGIGRLMHTTALETYVEHSLLSADSPHERTKLVIPPALAQNLRQVPSFAPLRYYADRRAHSHSTFWTAAPPFRATTFSESTERIMRDPMRIYQEISALNRKKEDSSGVRYLDLEEIPFIKGNFSALASSSTPSSSWEDTSLDIARRHGPFASVPVPSILKKWLAAEGIFPHEVSLRQALYVAGKHFVTNFKLETFQRIARDAAQPDGIIAFALRAHHAQDEHLTAHPEQINEAVYRDVKAVITCIMLRAGVVLISEPALLTNRILDAAEDANPEFAQDVRSYVNRVNAASCSGRVEANESPDASVFARGASFYAYDPPQLQNESDKLPTAPPAPESPTSLDLKIPDIEVSEPATPSITVRMQEKVSSDDFAMLQPLVPEDVTTEEDDDEAYENFEKGLPSSYASPFLDSTQREAVQKPLQRPQPVASFFVPDLQRDPILADEEPTSTPTVQGAQASPGLEAVDSYAEREAAPSPPSMPPPDTQQSFRTSGSSSGSSDRSFRSFSTESSTWVIAGAPTGDTMERAASPGRAGSAHSERDGRVHAGSATIVQQHEHADEQYHAVRSAASVSTPSADTSTDPGTPGTGVTQYGRRTPRRVVQYADDEFELEPEFERSHDPVAAQLDTPVASPPMETPPAEPTEPVVPTTPLTNGYATHCSSGGSNPPSRAHSPAPFDESRSRRVVPGLIPILATGNLIGGSLGYLGLPASVREAVAGNRWRLNSVELMVELRDILGHIEIRGYSDDELFAHGFLSRLRHSITASSTPSDDLRELQRELDSLTGGGENFFDFLNEVYGRVSHLDKKIFEKDDHPPKPEPDQFARITSYRLAVRPMGQILEPPPANSPTRSSSTSSMPELESVSDTSSRQSSPLYTPSEVSYDSSDDPVPPPPPSEESKVDDKPSSLNPEAAEFVPPSPLRVYSVRVPPPPDAEVIEISSDSDEEPELPDVQSDDDRQEHYSPEVLQVVGSVLAQLIARSGTSAHQPPTALACPATSTSSSGSTSPPDFGKLTIGGRHEGLQADMGPTASGGPVTISLHGQVRGANGTSAFGRAGTSSGPAASRVDREDYTMEDRGATQAQAQPQGAPGSGEGQQPERTRLRPTRGRTYTPGRVPERHRRALVKAGSRSSRVAPASGSSSSGESSDSSASSRASLPRTSFRKSRTIRERLSPVPGVSIEDSHIPYDRHHPAFVFRAGEPVTLVFPALANLGHAAFRARLNVEADRIHVPAAFLGWVDENVPDVGASSIIHIHAVLVRQLALYIVQAAVRFIGPELESGPSDTRNDELRHFEEALLRSPFGIHAASRLNIPSARNAYLRRSEVRFLEALAAYFVGTGRQGYASAIISILVFDTPGSWAVKSLLAGFFLDELDFPGQLHTYEARLHRLANLLELAAPI